MSTHHTSMTQPDGYFPPHIHVRGPKTALTSSCCVLLRLAPKPSNLYLVALKYRSSGSTYILNQYGVTCKADEEEVKDIEMSNLCEQSKSAREYWLQVANVQSLISYNIYTSTHLHGPLA